MTQDKLLEQAQQIVASLMPQLVANAWTDVFESFVWILLLVVVAFLMLQRSSPKEGSRMFLFSPKEESNRNDYSIALRVVALVMLGIGIGILIDTIFDVIRLSLNPQAVVIEELFKRRK